jgi:chromate transporter
MRETLEVAGLFLKLGATAFGGPAAHIAMMRREVVERRGWMTDGDFLDLLGATNLIPGPNSTEMAIHIGYLRAGWKGLIAAGFCFIVPAALIVTGLAWLYVRSGSVPQAGWLLYGIKPVIIALILQALWNLGRKALKSAAEKIAFVAVLTLYFLGLNETALLFGCGIAVLIAGWRPRREDRDGSGTSGADAGAEPDGNATSGAAKGASPILGLAAAGANGTSIATAGIAATAASAGTASGIPLLLLFLKFLKIGSVMYGSGYVLLPFLRGAFAGPGGWLSESQIMDAVSVGQFTPGPFFTTATFIGYLLGGMPGGLLATLGIFLPAFIFVAISNPWIPRLRRSKPLGRLLDGINVAALALMAGAAWQMGKASVTDWATASLAILSLYLLVRRNAPPTWLVIGGGVIGVGVRWLT